MSEQELKKDARQRFEKSLEHLSEMLRAIRTGRASSALVENIRVDYYGTPTPINQLASISIPEPRQIVIKPFDLSILKELGKAVMKSDLGTSPQDDGKVLRISLPPLSGEQRNKFGARVKELCEEARVAMRNGRRDVNKQADQLEKAGELTQDVNRKLHDDVQTMLKEFEGKVDVVQSKKVEEIMEV